MVRTTAVIAILMLFGATAAFPKAYSTPAEDNLSAHAPAIPSSAPQGSRAGDEPPPLPSGF